MTEILIERLCAEVPSDIIVFAIGMRINCCWKVWRWLPVFLAMPSMLREQRADPDIGLLPTHSIFGWRNIGVLQQGRSADGLYAYARMANGTHLVSGFNSRTVM